MSACQGKIAIITDDPGWHGRQLTQAFSRNGYDSCYVSLTDCCIQIASDQPELLIPDFSPLPDGVFVRGIPGGTLEQVIFRLDILHALHDLGITVFNQPRAIERTVDKPLTSLLLSRAGLPTPTTWICESQQQACDIIQRETSDSGKLVLKPLFGSQGIGVYLVDANSGLIHDEKFAGIYYLQRYIEQAGEDYNDIRVLVIDGVAQATMIRRSQHWITNRAQGASCEVLNQPDAEITSLAEAACQTLAIDYAGVDLIQDKNGQLFIIEVNSIPAWYGLQSVVDFNIADRLVDSFLSKLAAVSQSNRLLN